MVSFCKSIKPWGVILLIVLIGVVSYRVGYLYYQVNCKKEMAKKLEKYNENEYYTNESYKDEKYEEQHEESTEVVVNKIDRIKSTTIFTTIVIDKYNKTTNRECISIPLHFVGLTRIQLEGYFDYYMMNKPTEEMEKGLLKIEIVSFSSNEIIINKIYDASTVVYYITEKDGYIKVYYADRKTLYEDTGILVSNLPAIEKKNIQAGMFVRDKDELISILEGYSS